MSLINRQRELMLENEIFQLLEVVHDPEIPSLSIKDLGVLRTARVSEGVVEVVITPTYSGCPAMDVIEADIIKCLTSNGFRNVLVTTRLAPAWTTEWLSDRGRETLKKAGIAPPSRCGTLDFSANKVVQCPMCNSKSVELLSQFGTTACKALYRCHSCLEPFDYFKCH